MDEGNQTSPSSPICPILPYHFVPRKFRRLDPIAEFCFLDTGYFGIAARKVVRKLGGGTSNSVAVPRNYRSRGRGRAWVRVDVSDEK